MPYSVEQFSSIPAKEQTLELCEEAVLRDCRNIKYVAKRFLSQELCLKAMEQNAHACLYIKKEALTAEIIVAFFKQLGTYSLEYAGDLFRKFMARREKFKNFKLEDVVDKESAIEMVKAYGNSFLLLPPVYLKDRDVVLASLETYGKAIEYIPVEEQTKEMALRAAKGGAPRTFLAEKFDNDDEVINALLIGRPSNYHYLEYDERTYQRCLLAVQHGLDFEYVDKKYYTQEIFDALMVNRKVLLGEIPTEFLTKGILKLFLEDEPKRYYLKDLSPDIMDEELAYLAVCKGLSLEIPCIRKHQSERIIKEALKESWRDIEYVNTEFLTKELAEWLIKQSPESIKAFPKEVLSEELCYFAVTKEVDLSCFDASFQSQRIIDEVLKNRILAGPTLKDSDKLTGRGLTQKLDKMIEEVSRAKATATIGLIRDEFKTESFYIEVVKQNYLLLDDVPKNVLSEDILISLLHSDWRYIQYIPKEHHTPNVAIAVLETNPEAIDFLEL